MRRLLLLIWGSVGLAACTFGDVGDGAPGEDETEDADESDDGAVDSTPADGTVGMDDDDDDDDDDAPFEGCPESLPDGWLFCEDFEDLGGLGEVFSSFGTAEGRFGLHEGTAANGDWSLRLQHAPPVTDGGWVGVLFDPPFDWDRGPVYPAAESMDDLYVQVKVRTSDGWPGASIGRTFRIASLADASWTMPFQASVDAPTGSQAVRISAYGCDNCMGVNDWMNYPLLNQPPFGMQDLFGEAEEAQWRCVEFRLRLNAAGASDSEIRMWIDGEEDIVDGGFDWRGESDAGWHYVAIRNAWPGVVMPIDGELFYDDFIIATVPIGGC